MGAHAARNMMGAWSREGPSIDARARRDPAAAPPSSCGPMHRLRARGRGYALAHAHSRKRTHVRLDLHARANLNARAG